MDNKDKDLKKALDDIFGSDFIEIDVKEKKKKKISKMLSCFFRMTAKKILIKKQ